MDLTSTQLATLKNAILADPALAALPFTYDDADYIAREFNKLATPDFTVWKSSIPAPDVGNAFDAASLDAMTSGNAEKLSNFRNWNETVYPSRFDHRAFFDGIFSPTSGATTRANLYALWRRKATRFEKLYATGTGTDVSPATLVIEGNVDYATVYLARLLP